MALPALPPQGASTDTGNPWYPHYSAMDGAVRDGIDLYKPTVIDIVATGTRDSGTVLHGDGVWRAVTIAQDIVRIGTTAAPLTSATTARPVNAVVVYWLMANGVHPVNSIGADLIWKAP